MESNHDQWHEKSSLYFNYKNLNDQHPKITPTNKNYQQRIHWPPSPLKHLIMMKLRFPLRHLPNLANPNRPVLSNTLHIRHNNSFLISYTHLSRRKLRMSYSLSTCKRSIHILYLPIHPRRPRPILRILYIPRNMKHWSSSTIYRYSNSLHRLRPALRTNIILRSYGHHKSTISYPLYRNRPRRMNLRGLFRRQSNPHTILRLSLYPAIHHYRPRSRTSPIPARNRIQQPYRNLIRHRQNSISPILHY